MVRGVTHAEYRRAHADGRCYFIAIAALVGGAPSAGLVEVATGIDLWREWARLEVANLRCQPYNVPDAFETHAGSVLCAGPADGLALSEFTAPEIAVRMDKYPHAGLIVRSGDPLRVNELLDRFSAEFAERLQRTQPPA